MKSRLLMGLAAMTSSAALTIPIALAAQDANKTRHHHYKMIDIGTFGGPSSFFNTLSVTDGFGFGTVFYNNALVVDPQGTLIGFADTAEPDPYPAFCYTPDCRVTHAFQWRKGVRTDLGVLPGGASSAAFWINSNGLITGNSENGELDPVIPDLPEVRAVIWKNGRITDLGTLGGSSSFSQAVNDRGQVTGLALNGIPDPFSFYYQFLYCLPFGFCPPNATQTRGFVWDEEDGMQDIGTLGGPDAFPSVINNHGQIAGFSYTDSTPHASNGGFPTLHPFLWEKGKGMRDLGSLGGTTTASVNGLNERGEVVGGATLPGDLVNQPFLWDGNKLIDLITPPFVESANGEARWINEAGEVVGGASLSMSCAGGGLQTHGFVWKAGVMTDLGSLSEFLDSEAEFINSKAQVVGLAFPCDGSAVTGFLWENGSMIDLNALIPPDSPLQVSWASYISDRGEIVAFSFLPNGDTHTVLLIPCDENHPDIERCDYSPVEASTIAAGHPAADAAVKRQLTPQEISRIRAVLMKRHRGFMPRTMH